MCVGENDQNFERINQKELYDISVIKTSLAEWLHAKMLSMKNEATRKNSFQDEYTQDFSLHENNVWMVKAKNDDSFHAVSIRNDSP